MLLTFCGIVMLVKPVWKKTLSSIVVRLSGSKMPANFGQPVNAHPPSSSSPSFSWTLEREGIFAKAFFPMRFSPLPQVTAVREVA